MIEILKEVVTACTHKPVSWFVAVGVVSLMIGLGALAKAWSRRTGVAMLATAGLMVLISAGFAVRFFVDPPRSDPGIALLGFFVLWFLLMAPLGLVEIGCILSLVIRGIARSVRHGKDAANHTPDGICQPADGLPKPSV
jgi:hypothetical protein